MRDLGFPVGPMKLLDEVGIDVAAKVGPIMKAEFGERLEAPPGVEKLVADKRHGRKNKRGLYLYSDDRKGKRGVDETVYALMGVTPNKHLPGDEIGERCTLQMLNEAAYCFEEGILRSARDGDIGAIFGLGFPPFLGGPFRFADRLGLAKVVEKMKRYQDQHGRRFAPAAILEDMAKTGATFHGERAVAPGGAPRTKVVVAARARA
jgi:3-hydroxyacyl-CoA dehydrogenase/enoyl-CoA hydratase/3-hydroxybutyryl-CoA epimerase